MRRYFSFHVLVGAMFLSAIVLLALPQAASSAANAALRRYPYLTDVVGPYATINWATDRSETAGAVRYGKMGSESCTAHYVPATKTPIFVNGVFQYQWKALLDLEPGAQYCYRVYLGTSPVNEVDLLGSDASPSFWTQVPAGDPTSFSFLVFGDWGYVGSAGTNPYQAALMSLMASSGSRFAVTTGDNGYPGGNQKNYGDLIQTGADTSAVFGPSFWKVPGSSLPIFLTQGNHGFDSPDTFHPALINWPQDQAVATSGGRYAKENYCCANGSNPGQYPSMWYAFDAGPARFYILEASWTEVNLGTATEYEMDYDYHWAPGTPQWEWLKADLAAHPSMLKFAFFHNPLYSDNPHEPTDTFLLGPNSLEGLLKQNGVDLAFTGHAHIYERNFASADGIPNYITGGGGATPGTLGTCTPLDAYAIKFTDSGAACGSAPVPTSAGQLYHFLKVTVKGSTVTVTPINSLGQAFDVMTYDFSAGVEATPPSVPTNVTAIPLSGTQINLSWSASADDTGVRGYGIYRNGTLVDTVAGNTLSYSDDRLIPATNYVYKVDAFDGTGNRSTPSTPASAITGSAATYTFNPVADAYVSDTSTGTNHGLAEVLQADGTPANLSYIRFNVNETHGTVARATLRLFAAAGSTTDLQIYNAANQMWEEAQITFANAPGVGTLLSSPGDVAQGTWLTVDVTPYITGNGVYDFVLTSPSAINFNSRDATVFQPELIVETGAVAAAGADLTLDKSVSSTAPNVDTNITFTLTVTNQGPEPASGVEVTDQLPSGYTYVLSNPSQGAYNNLTGRWTIGDLAVNASATLQIIARVNISGAYTNVAEISAALVVDPDSTPGNANPNEDDRDEATIAVTRGMNSANGNLTAARVLTGFAIPVTGYAPNVRTELKEATKTAYESTELSIKIPSLAVDTSIVGVPYKDRTWNVSWLGKEAGWLQGTAYPTFTGNSVITGHLVTADGKPGPFYNLKLLTRGEYIYVDNGGFRYIYKVALKNLVQPNDESILDHRDESWLTLVTCDSYDPESGTYLRRLVVGAKLVRIVQEK